MGIFNTRSRNSAEEQAGERLAYMNMTEKELMVEIILELKNISWKCSEINQSIIIWSK